MEIIDKDGMKDYERIIRKLNSQLGETERQLNLERENRQRIETHRTHDFKSKEKIESRLHELETIFNNELKLHNSRNNDEDYQALKRENDILKSTLEEVNRQKSQLISSLKQETEQRKNLEAKLERGGLEGYSKLSALYKDLEASFNSLNIRSELYKHKISEQEITIKALNLTLQDKDKVIKDLESEKNALKEDVETADEKNKQLYLALEKGLITRAKDYKEKTLTALNQSNEKIKRTNRYQTLSPDFDQTIDSIRIESKHESQSGLSKSTSELIDLIGPSMSPIQSVSPIRSERITEVQMPRLKLNDQQGHEQFTPPTFRNPELNSSFQGSLDNSFIDIKKRLNYLQANKALLENRMDDFDQKQKFSSEII